MNKTDRMLAIVLELQGKGRQRAEDLAETFETSKRTIYRDIQALCEAGVPLISTPGYGYALMQGYFLPPLSFTTEEAIMLLLGSDYMARNFDAQYQAAAQTASRKIEGVLPERLRGDVRYLQESIRFFVLQPPGNAAEHDKLAKLRRAILDRTTVRFDYHTRYRDNDQAPHNTREADPYGLAYFANAWHLIAYCHLRQGLRNFRLERMENLELLNKTFQRPANFKVQRPAGEVRNITVRALFDHEVARWVHEARHYSTVSTEETPDGLLLTLTIRHVGEVLQWLLSWGRHVRVLEPESLRKQLLAEAEAMMRHYQAQK